MKMFSTVKALVNVLRRIRMKWAQGFVSSTWQSTCCLQGCTQVLIITSKVGIKSPGFKSQLGEVMGYTACIWSVLITLSFSNLMTPTCLYCWMGAGVHQSRCWGLRHGHPDSRPSSVLNHHHWGQLEAPSFFSSGHSPPIPLLGRWIQDPNIGPCLLFLLNLPWQSWVIKISLDPTILSHYRESILWDYVRVGCVKSDSLISSRSLRKKAKQAKRNLPGMCLETSFSKGDKTPQPLDSVISLVTQSHNWAINEDFTSPAAKCFAEVQNHLPAFLCPTCLGSFSNRKEYSTQHTLPWAPGDEGGAPLLLLLFQTCSGLASFSKHPHVCNCSKSMFYNFTRELHQAN